MMKFRDKRDEEIEEQPQKVKTVNKKKSEILLIVIAIVIVMMVILLIVIIVKSIADKPCQ